MERKLVVLLLLIVGIAKAQVLVEITPTNMRALRQMAGGKVPIGEWVVRLCNTTDEQQVVLEEQISIAGPDVIQFIDPAEGVILIKGRQFWKPFAVGAKVLNLAATSATFLIAAQIITTTAGWGAATALAIPLTRDAATWMGKRAQAQEIPLDNVMGTGGSRDGIVLSPKSQIGSCQTFKAFANLAPRQHVHTYRFMAGPEEIARIASAKRWEVRRSTIDAIHGYGAYARSRLITNMFNDLLYPLDVTVKPLAVEIH